MQSSTTTTNSTLESTRPSSHGTMRDLLFLRTTMASCFPWISLAKVPTTRSILATHMTTSAGYR